MNLMLLTLRKDLRRLWPVVVLTLAMLAELGRVDRWRADWMASSTESWLTILVTLAWSCLAALVVLEEPLVGDRHFWTTRPHRWLPLLSAKVLFVILTIHLPLLLENSYVLLARGFDPATDLNNLLWKQALLFSAVTLPSIAAATLVRSFTHFVVAAFAVAVVILIVNGGFEQVAPWLPVSVVRHAILRILVVLAACVIVAMMYARRSVLPARIVAGIGVVLAASIAAWLPARAEYLQYDVNNRIRIALRDAPLDSMLSFAGPARYVVLLPVSVAGDRKADPYFYPLVDLEIETPDGAVIRTLRHDRYHLGEKIDLTAQLITQRGELQMTFSDSAWKQVRNAPVRLRGEAPFHFYSRGNPTPLPIGGSAIAPGVGRCDTSIPDNPLSSETVRVFCESVFEIPQTEVKIRLGQLHRDVIYGLNSAMTYAPGPHEDWLSPLNRAQAFFPVGTYLLPEEQRRVSEDQFRFTQIEITPQLPAGDALASFDFPNITLSKWLAQAPQAPRAP